MSLCLPEQVVLDSSSSFPQSLSPSHSQRRGMQRLFLHLNLSAEQVCWSGEGEKKGALKGEGETGIQEAVCGDGERKGERVRRCEVKTNTREGRYSSWFGLGFVLSGRETCLHFWPQAERQTERRTESISRAAEIVYPHIHGHSHTQTLAHSIQNLSFHSGPTTLLNSGHHLTQ